MLTPLEKWYDADTPEVSVVIPNFNKSDLTRKCLHALWANTNGYRYEIVVVDNGSSPDDVQNLINAGAHLRLIRLAENRYFGDACNTGAEHSKGRFLVFLNNDAFVTLDWLAPLIGVLDGCLDAGGAGPRFIDPDGQLQEAGAFIDETGNSLRVGQFEPYHPREEFERRIVDYCSAACLAVPKWLFAELGSFDPIYNPAYYEDVDLCLKIAAANRFVYYCPESTVIHIKNATAAHIWNAAELRQIIERNRQKFLSRWGNWLQARAENREIPFPTFGPSSAPHSSNEE